MRPAVFVGSAFALTAIGVLALLLYGVAGGESERSVSEGPAPDGAAEEAERSGSRPGAVAGARPEGAPPRVQGSGPRSEPGAAVSDRGAARDPGALSDPRAGSLAPPPPRAGFRGTAPPVESPREVVESLAEERQEIVGALVEEMTPELRRCTAQSSAPETFLRSAMLQVRVEERPEGFAPRVHAVLGAQVEDAVHRCWHEVLSASPFPPPHEALDRMEDGWRHYEVWIGAQVEEPEAGGDSGQ